jgi:hypothetical protein
VTVIPVRYASQLQRTVAALRAAPLIYQTADTAVFEDGRIVTSEVEHVGAHLNELGWTENPLKISGAAAGAAGTARYAWRSGQGLQQGSAAPPPRRRRG